MTLRTGLFFGEHGVRFDPCVGLDGRRFLAMLGINEAARCLGLPSLFAHLCKQGIERGEHRLVIESDGALLLAAVSVSSSRSASVLESTVAGIRLVTTWTGGLPM